MNIKSSSSATICANLLFCLSVISFFGANTTLRLPAVGALYKEYLTGCIALVLFYFQKIILYPKLRHRIPSRYIWIYLSLALISAILEIILVHPQVMEILLIDNSKKEALYCLLYYGFFVFLRDAGILVASFFFCEFMSQNQLCNIYEIRIRETTDEIPVWVGVENIKGGLIPLPPVLRKQHLCLPKDNSFENESKVAPALAGPYFGDDLSYSTHIRHLVLYPNEKHSVYLFLGQQIVFPVPILEKNQESSRGTYFLSGFKGHTCDEKIYNPC